VRDPEQVELGLSGGDLTYYRIQDALKVVWVAVQFIGVVLLLSKCVGIW
jgi:hypothetical protein